MSSNWEAFVSDPRVACKYGTKCYQKNPDHLKQYKHPPIAKRKTVYQNSTNKRLKCNNEICENLPAKASSSNTEPENDNLNNTLPQKEIKFTLPETISYFDKDSDRKVFQEIFHVQMPSDFFKFYECLAKEDQPVEKILQNVNLELIGPYDLLLGKLPMIDDKDLYLIHWRFFFDPPEFQAVMKKKGKSEYHIGYFRDTPEEMPLFLAKNDSSQNCLITPIAENIFGAVYWYLQNEKKSSPFAMVPCEKLIEKIKKWSEEHKYSLEEYKMSKRLSKIVTRTFHSAGIVVPYNKKTQLGYRPLIETDAKLKKLFAKLKTAKSKNEENTILSELQPVITYANIAMDECDFGTLLEAGIDLFCSGLELLEPNALSCLTTAYTILKRQAFAKIIQAHLKHRRKGPNLSLMSL